MDLTFRFLGSSILLVGSLVSGGGLGVRLWVL